MENIRHPSDLNEQFIKFQEETIARTLTFFSDYVECIKDGNLTSIAVALAIGYLDFSLPYLNPSKKYKKLLNWYENFFQRPSMQPDYTEQLMISQS